MTEHKSVKIWATGGKSGHSDFSNSVYLCYIISCPVLIWIIGAFYVLDEYTGKFPYHHLYFGKILYRTILKTIVNFSMKLSAFIWNMIVSR